MIYEAPYAEVWTEKGVQRQVVAVGSVGVSYPGELEISYGQVNNVHFRPKGRILEIGLFLIDVNGYFYTIQGCGDSLIKEPLPQKKEYYIPDLYEGIKQMEEMN